MKRRNPGDSNLLYHVENKWLFRPHIWTTGRLSEYNFSSLITNIKKIYTSDGFKFTSCNTKSLSIQTTHKDTTQIVALQF